MNYETGCIGKFSETKHKDVSKTIATAKMELFLVSQRAPTKALWES